MAGPEAHSLLLELLAQALDRVANLAAGAAETFLNGAGGLLGDAFTVELLVVGEIARRLLDLALQLVALAFEFIAVHAETSLRDSRELELTVSVSRSAP